LKTSVENLYEGLFLVDSAFAASDFEGILGTIRAILEKAEAEIVSIKKWDERRLAYEIKGVSRGTYILAYFNAEGQSVSQIEREVQLSERIMRVLILRVEKGRQQSIEEKVPAERGEQRPERSERPTVYKPAGSGRMAAEPEGSSKAVVEQAGQERPAEQKADSDKLQQAEGDAKEPVEKPEQ